MNRELWDIDHANPAHREWLREAWGWVVANPGRYNHDGRFQNEDEFVYCSDGYREWAILADGKLQAIVTAHFGDDATCEVHVTARPRPMARVTMAALRILERYAFQTCTDLQTTIPDLPAFNSTRKLARKMGYRQLSCERFIKWFYEQT